MKTTFQSTRGKSNIDLTITNNQMPTDVKNWDIPEEERASDHNIIKFSINLDKNTTHGKYLSEPRYRSKEHQLTKFSEKLKFSITKTFEMEDKGRNKRNRRRTAQPGKRVHGHRTVHNQTGRSHPDYM